MVWCVCLCHPGPNQPSVLLVSSLSSCIHGPITFAIRPLAPRQPPSSNPSPSSWKLKQKSCVFSVGFLSQTVHTYKHHDTNKGGTAEYLVCLTVCPAHLVLWQHSSYPVPLASPLRLSASDQSPHTLSPLCLPPQSCLWGTPRGD